MTAQDQLSPLPQREDAFEVGVHLRRPQPVPEPSWYSEIQNNSGLVGSEDPSRKAEVLNSCLVSQLHSFPF